MCTKRIKLYFLLLVSVFIVSCGSSESDQGLSDSVISGKASSSATDNIQKVKPLEEEEVSEQFVPVPTQPVVVEDLGAPLPLDLYAALGGGGGGGIRRHCNNDSCDLGVATHTAPDLNWYVVNTEAFPIVKPLSIDRNAGFTRGAVELTDTGLKVNVAGTYWVSYFATMAFFNDADDYNPLIPIFLIKNGVFNPEETASLLGTTQTMLKNFIMTFTGSGLVADLQAGDTLSLVITNGGSPQPEPITILAWSISAHKICD